MSNFLNKKKLNEAPPPVPGRDAGGATGGPPPVTGRGAVSGPPPVAGRGAQSSRIGSRWKSCSDDKLELGCRGNNVKDLQRKIMSKNIPLKFGDDGKFGNSTKTALKEYQRILGADQTGVYDQETRNRENSKSSATEIAPPPPTPAPAPPVSPTSRSAEDPVKGTDDTSSSKASTGEDKEQSKKLVYDFIDSFQSRLDGKPSYLRNVTFGNNENMKDLADYLIDDKNYSSQEALNFFKKMFEEKAEFVDSQERIKRYSKYDLIFSRNIGEFITDSNSLIEFRKEELKKIYNSIDLGPNDRNTILGRFKNFILSKIERFSPQLASTLSESKLQQNYYLEPVKSRFNKLEKLVFERLVKNAN